MPDTESEIELDRILAVLENPIRRRILQKLSREMNYPLQLSKELHVSQQAIMKHLKVLEDSDFVVSAEERSDKGGPPRKVYIPRKRYCIRIDIGPNTYNEEFYSFREYNLRKREEGAPPPSSETAVEIDGKVTGEMKNEVAGALPAFTDPLLEGYRIKLERVLDVDNADRKLGALRQLISSLNRDIDLQEMRRRRLLAIRERAFEDVNEIITRYSDDYLEKEILSLFVKDEIEDIDSLSDILDARRIYVENVLEQIKKRLGRI
jgi:predicted transcriptional regulator